LNNLIFQSKQNIFFSSEKSAQAFSPYLKGVNSQLISFCFYQSFSVLGVLTLHVDLFLLWSVLVQDGISDYGRNLLTHPLADVYVSNNCIGEQNPFIYIVRAVTFLGEKGGWQIFLQTIHHAASNMLLFNSGRSKISSLIFLLCCFRTFLWFHVSGC